MYKIGKFQIEENSYSQEKPPGISLCMILRNEEEFLPLCLESVQGAVDEIIAVDTGSTDRTIEIARSFGAHIFHFDWNDDFSAARNESINKASYNWILIMDADERLDANSIQYLKKAISNKGCLAYNLTIIDIYDEKNPDLNKQFKSCRLFQNKPQLRYEWEIHNQIYHKVLELAQKEKLFIKEDDNIIIYHYGYTDKGLKLHDTYKRSKRILEKALLNDSIDNFKKLYYLVKLSSLPNEDKISYLNQALEILDNFPKHILYDNSIVIDLFYDLSDYYYQKKQYEKSMEFCQRGMRFSPLNPAFLYMYGLILYKLKNYKQSIEFYNRCITVCKSGIYNKTVVLPYSIINCSLLNYLIAHSYWNLGNLHQARYYLNKSLEIDPDNNEIKEDIKKIDQEIKKKVNKFTISLCMVVKNEEKFLDKCLKSVYNVVDEIIIADLGSTDCTIEIAQNYGAKVIEFNENQDLYQAKNKALKEVTCDWILFMNPDEELDSFSQPLLKYIDDKNVLAYNILLEKVYDINHPQSLSWECRLFRNNKGIIFQNQNEVDFFNLVKEIATFEKMKIAQKPITIYKYGYSKYLFMLHQIPITNIDILKNKLKNKDISLEERFLYTIKLGVVLRNNSIFDEAEKIFSQIIQEIISWETSKIQQFPLLIEAYIGLSNIYYTYYDKPNIAFQICNKAIEYFPYIPILWYLCANFLNRMENYEESIRYYEKCIEFGITNRFFRLLTFDHGITSYHSLYGLGYSYFCLGNSSLAKKYFQQTLSINSNYIKAKQALSQIIF